MHEAERQFRTIVDKMKMSAHGSAHLSELSELMRTLTKQKRPFLKQRLLQRVIPWDENKERKVWSNDKVADQNKYWFLQGYLIESRHVIGPNGVENHREWMVLSVDCDCVRAPYVSVGKITQAGDAQEERQRLSLASSFKTAKYFPVPPHEGVETWSIVDLETPFHLERANLQFTDAIQSLTVDGWHILNAVLQERYTRALDIQEARQLRTEEAGE